MNLHDVITIRQPNEDNKAARKKPASKLDAISSDVDDLLAFRRVSRRVGGDDVHRAMNSLARTVGEAAFQDLWNDVENKQEDRVVKAIPGIARIRSSPRSTMSSIQSVADALHMVVIPFAYLEPRARDMDGYSTAKEIESFVNDVSPFMDAYVVCPVDHYSVERHVATPQDQEKPIFAPPSLSQAFMAIGMSIPMFRAMKNDIESLRHQVRNWDDRIRNVEQEIRSLRAKVGEMAARLEEETRARIAAEESTKRWLASDPMLIGLPRNGNGSPSFSGDAVIGPCWGPDFEDIVATAVGLKKKPNQRDKVWKALNPA